LPLFFLLFMSFVTGAFAAYAGRDELRHNGGAMWRAESFLAYLLFFLLALLPTAIYFYVFHGDWFLFYWVNTGQAPWLWGALTAVLLCGAGLAGFGLGAALCRGSRDTTARRLGTLGTILAVGVWPLAWQRLSRVGTYRQYDREYGLTPYFESAAFFSGIAMLLVLIGAFAWLAMRIERQTRDFT
jgi:hypothetical protein